MQEEVPKRVKKAGINWPMLVGFGLVLIAVVIVIYILTQGETKIISGKDSEKTRSITCVSNEMSYQFFRYDNSNSKEMVIRGVFGSEELSSISLDYMLYYSDAADITKSEAENHAAMNLKFQDESLGPDALDAKYTELADGMKMSLYAKRSEINNLTSKYFYLPYMITGEDEDYNIYSLSYVEDLYQKMGFNCEISDI